MLFASGIHWVCFCKRVKVQFFKWISYFQVEKNDGLSEIICKKCLARLQIAYDFKRQAVESNRELRSFISNVNKQFQQVTANNALGKLKNRQKDVESESYDELEDDMQAMIEDEVEYKEIEVEYADETKKTEIDRDQLVEILGDNNAITIRKTRVTVQEDASNENVEVYLMDTGMETENEVDTEYMLDEYEQNEGELITDDIDEAQYLEEDHIEDPDYESVRNFFF